MGENEFMTLEEFEKSGKCKISEKEKSDFINKIIHTQTDIWHGIPSKFRDLQEYFSPEAEHDPVIMGVCKGIQYEDRIRMLNSQIEILNSRIKELEGSRKHTKSRTQRRMSGRVQQSKKKR